MQSNARRSRHANKPVISNSLGLAIISLLAFCSPASAQDIRWKFAVGDEFSVVQRQATTIDTRVEKRDSKIGSAVTLTGSWKVTSVSDADADVDVASIEQTIDSIKVAIDNPADSTKSVAIDTARSKKPAKNSRDLLKELKPLIGMTFTLQMNDRGEVLDVSVPSDTQQRLDAIPSDSWLKALLDPGKLKGQIQSTALPLPERDLTEGQSVELTPATKASTVVAAPLGKRKMTYTGNRNSGDRQLDVFTLSTTEKFDAVKASPPGDSPASDQPDVGTFEWSGELLFDREAGHCRSCESQATIKTSRLYRAMKMSTAVVVESNFQLERK